MPSFNTHATGSATTHATSTFALHIKISLHTKGVTMPSLPDAHSRGHKSVMDFQKALLLVQIPIVDNVLLFRCYYHGCFSVR